MPLYWIDQKRRAILEHILFRAQTILWQLLGMRLWFFVRLWS